MKKSNNIFLTAIFLTAIASCKQKDEWIAGSEGGTVRDTTMNGNSYRHYGGLWYPIIGGMIAPRMYNGATATEISRPGYKPGRVRTGGFGTSSRSASS